MLFDEPSSSSPSDGDTRPPAVTRPTLRATPAPVERYRAPQPPGDRTPAGQAHDPRLIESAGAPAPEALRATAIAGAVVRELYESGREVRFAFVPTRNRVTVLLCDMDGGVLSRLTPGRALEIATGEPVPGTRRR
jgi:hypothetical protein